MTKKKMISFLMAFCLLIGTVGIVPVQAASPIDHVSIVFDTSAVPYTAYADGGQCYIDQFGGMPLRNEFNYVIGTQYSFDLVRTDNNVFVSTSTFDVNGIPTSDIWIQNDSQATVYYDLYDYQEAALAALNYAETGDPSNPVSVGVIGAGVYIDNVQSALYEVSPGQMAYNVSVDVHTESGYIFFTQYQNTSVNDTMMSIAMADSFSGTVIQTIPRTNVPTQTLDTVAIHMDTSGSSYTFSPLTPGFTISGIGREPLRNDFSLVVGETFGLEITADPGYVLSDNVQATVDMVYGIWVKFSDTTGILYYDVMSYLTPYVEVIGVSETDDPNKPVMVGWAGYGYHVDNVSWKKETLSSGKTGYVVTFDIKADDGYVFIGTSVYTRIFDTTVVIPLSDSFTGSYTYELESAYQPEPETQPQETEPETEEEQKEQIITVPVSLIVETADKELEAPEDAIFHFDIQAEGTELKVTDDTVVVSGSGRFSDSLSFSVASKDDYDKLKETGFTITQKDGNAEWEFDTLPRYFVYIENQNPPGFYTNQNEMVKVYESTLHITNVYKGPEEQGPKMRTVTLPVNVEVLQCGKDPVGKAEFHFTLENLPEGEYQLIRDAVSVPGAGKYQGELILSCTEEDYEKLLESSFVLRERSAVVPGWSFAGEAWEVSLKDKDGIAYPTYAVKYKSAKKSSSSNCFVNRYSMTEGEEKKAPSSVYGIKDILLACLDGSNEFKGSVYAIDDTDDLDIEFSFYNVMADLGEADLEIYLNEEEFLFEDLFRFVDGSFYLNMTDLSEYLSDEEEEDYEDLDCEWFELDENFGIILAEVLAEEYPVGKRLSRLSGEELYELLNTVFADAVRTGLHQIPVTKVEGGYTIEMDEADVDLMLEEGVTAFAQTLKEEGLLTRKEMKNLLKTIPSLEDLKLDEFYFTFSVLETDEGYKLEGELSAEKKGLILLYTEFEGEITKITDSDPDEIKIEIEKPEEALSAEELFY